MVSSVPKFERGKTRLLAIFATLRLGLLKFLTKIQVQDFMAIYAKFSQLSQHKQCLRYGETVYRQSWGTQVGWGGGVSLSPCLFSSSYFCRYDGWPSNQFTMRCARNFICQTASIKYYINGRVVQTNWLKVPTPQRHIICEGNSNLPYWELTPSTHPLSIYALWVNG